MPPGNKEIIDKVEVGIVPISLSDPTILQRIKIDPVKTIAEIGLGIWSGGLIEAAKSGARIFRAARFQQGFSQFASELERFQKDGKIETDVEITANKLFTKSFVDLMDIIDSNPDEDYLTAVKGLFFLLLSVDEEESDKVKIYQIMVMIKKLSASELSTLFCVYELYKEVKWQGIPTAANNWSLAVTEKSPHKISGFIENDEEKLMKLRLITPRRHTDRSGIDKENWRLTDIGIALCEYVEKGKTKFYS